MGGSGGHVAPFPALGIAALREKKNARGRLAWAARVEEVAGGRENHLPTTGVRLTRRDIG
jgi:hypothetical protein